MATRVPAEWKKTGGGLRLTAPPQLLATGAGMSEQAAVQELRRVCAIACAWLTPGSYPPRHVEGISIPEVDLDQREVVVMLHAALRDTAVQS